MTIFARSLGGLIPSQGFFDFVWMDIPAIRRLEDVRDMSETARPFMERFSHVDDFVPNTLPPIVEADRPVGPSAPMFEGPVPDSGDPSFADDGPTADTPLIDVRWTDPVFDPDLSPGGVGPLEAFRVLIPEGALWEVDPFMPGSGWIDYAATLSGSLWG